MTGIFIALISGALMSLQGVFNTEVLGTVFCASHLPYHMGAV